MEISDVIIALVSAFTGGGAVGGGLALRSRSKNGSSDVSRSERVDRELRRREDVIRREAQLEVAVANLTKALEDLVQLTDQLRKRAHEHASKLQEHELRIAVLERDTGPHRTIG